MVFIKNDEKKKGNFISSRFLIFMPVIFILLSDDFVCLVFFSPLYKTV
jgi:hypothetical protein